MTSSFVCKGNQCTELVKVLYCKLPTISKQLPTFPHKDQGSKRRPQRWEACLLLVAHNNGDIDINTSYLNN